MASFLVTGGNDNTGTPKPLQTDKKGKMIVSKGQKFKLINLPVLAIQTTAQEIYATTEPCVIDSLVYLTNDPLAYITIGIRDSAGVLQPIPIIRVDSYGTSPNISFKRIKADDTLAGGYCDYMELIVYDDVNKRYFMRNTSPIDAPHGCRITVSSSANPCSGTLVAGIKEEV